VGGGEALPWQRGGGPWRVVADISTRPPPPLTRPAHWSPPAGGPTPMSWRAAGRAVPAGILASQPAPEERRDEVGRLAESEPLVTSV